MTATPTITMTATETRTPTKTGSSTVTLSSSVTLTLTLTQTVTPVPTGTPVCGSITFGEVTLTFNPEHSQDMIVESHITGTLLSSVVATIYPHSGGGAPMSVTMTLVPGTADLYRGLYTKATGFGDEERIVVKATDMCLISAESNSTFTRKVIAGTDVKVKNNIFDPTAGGTVKIQYSVPGPTSVLIEVFGEKGNKILTLVNAGSHDTGVFDATWNGRDSSGTVVGSGVYYVTISTTYYKTTKKVMLVK